MEAEGRRWGSGGEAPSKMGPFGSRPTGFFFARTGIDSLKRLNCLLEATLDRIATETFQVQAFIQRKITKSMLIGL